MCIRDRAHDALLKFSNPAFILLSTLISADGKMVDGATLIPVSYTHLRAHETVLDLVCRLLLEKKKKTKDIDQLTQQVDKRQDAQTAVQTHSLDTRTPTPYEQHYI